MLLVAGLEYQFTNLKTDPEEVQPLVAWSLNKLHTAVHSKYGSEVADWFSKAAKIGEWWLQEQDRLWNVRRK
ncbi:Alkaline-phosphatase core domain [Pyrenophora tritici-repentis]|nr:Alkaline-phosphatase core domain [Pyrenophora tritici-repentis]